MRRGDFLVENFLEIVLAIIGLLMVGYAGYLIYQASAHQDVAIAKKMLDSLEAKINRLEVGQSGTYTLQTPYRKDGNSWFLTGWGKDDADRPEKCYFQSCVCACAGKGTTVSTYANTCQTNGYCRFFDIPSLSFSDILKDYRIKAQGGDVTLARAIGGKDAQDSDAVAHGISFTEGVISVKVEKQTNGVLITKL